MGNWGEKTPISGVITLLITGRGAPCNMMIDIYIYILYICLISMFYLYCTSAQLADFLRSGGVVSYFIYFEVMNFTEMHTCG